MWVMRVVLKGFFGRWVFFGRLMCVLFVVAVVLVVFVVVGSSVMVVGVSGVFAGTVCWRGFGPRLPSF